MAFYKANHHLIYFPDHFIPEKINEFEFYVNGMRGGRHIRFFIAKDEQGHYYLDLFASTDDQSWHRRIRQDGSIKDLEIFEGQFGWPVYSDDPERTEREQAAIQVHNDRVLTILLAKGLILNTNNPAFERELVVRIDASPNV